MTAVPEYTYGNSPVWPTTYRHQAYDVMVFTENGHYYAMTDTGNIFCIDSPTNCMQEAINYVFYQLQGGVIFIRRGIYDFTNSPVLNLINGTVKFYIPANASTNTINIALIGEGAVGGPWEETSATSASGDVLFVDNTTTNYNGALFYADRLPSASGGVVSGSWLSNVNVYIDGIRFRMSYASGSSALALDQAGRAIIGRIYIETDQPSTSTNLINRAALYLSSGWTSVYNSADTIYIQGYQYGLYVGGHVHINHLILQNVGYGIIPDTNQGTGYIVGISKVTAQYIRNALIYNPNAVQFGVNIGILDLGDGISSTTTLINDAGNLYARIVYHYNGVTPSPSNLSVASSTSYELIPVAQSDMYQSSTSGPTAGTVTMLLVNNSSYYKKYVIIFSGYENATTTNQTINYPLPFRNYAVITANNTGLTVSTTTTGITITSPNSTSTYSGIVIVEGQ